MPTYEYECTRCGHLFERFQSITDEPVKRCPKCRCKVKRLLGAGAGIIFKGSGFYETDYKRPAAARGKSEGGGASESAGSKTASDSTKKPAASDGAKASSD